MSDKIEITNLDNVMRDLTREASNIEAASALSLAQVALGIEAYAKEKLTEVHNDGKRQPDGSHHIGGPGSFPNRRTGTLMRSVETKVTRGFNGYEASVEPGTVYARRLELGWSSGVNYPYMRPSAEYVRPRALGIFKQYFQRFYRS